MKSLSSGATEPSTRYPNQLWADTTSGLLKIRNTANTAWISLGPLDGSHTANTIRGRLTSDGVLQDLTVNQVKTLLSITASQLLTEVKTVDGSGSGLDADLLDGQQGSYYRNASNVNAGTLSHSRLPTSSQSEAEVGTVNTKTMTPLRTAQAILKHSGVSKTWINFNGTGTPAIKDSSNVSSLVDYGSGHFGISINNNMANNWYAPQTGGRFNSSYHGLVTLGGLYTGLCRVYGMTGNTTAAYLGTAYKSDQEMMSCSVFGDLA